MKVRIKLIAWDKPARDLELVNTGAAPAPTHASREFEIELPDLPKGWEVKEVVLDGEWGR